MNHKYIAQEEHEASCAVIEKSGPLDHIFYRSRQDERNELSGAEAVHLVLSPITSIV